MQEIRSALDGLGEDWLAPEALPLYDTCEDVSNPAMSLMPNGGIQEHEGRSIRLELAEHTDEELERGAKLLLLRAANRRRVQPDEVDVWFNQHCDLISQHILEIPEFLVGGGDYAIERGDALLVLTEPMCLGLVVRKGNLSSILVFNPRGVVRVDPLAERLPPPPLRRRWQPTPESRIQKRLRLQVERRAKALLFQFLSREQKWELRAYRRVTVLGQDGRVYRIYAWHGMNVRLVVGDKETHSLCVVPKPEVTTIPVLDLILAQKVLLENDVESFLATANTRVLR